LTTTIEQLTKVTPCRLKNCTDEL